MNCCVTEAIKSLAKEVEIFRQKSGAYDEFGKWMEREYEKFGIIKAVVQPARGHELVRVEEGRRTKGAIKLYTLTKLQTASVDTKTQPDRIKWNDRMYEVEFIDDWYAEAGYYKVVALEVGQ